MQHRRLRSQGLHLREPKRIEVTSNTATKGNGNVAANQTKKQVDMQSLGNIVSVSNNDSDSEVNVEVDEDVSSDAAGLSSQGYTLLGPHQQPDTGPQWTWHRVAVRPTT